MDPIPPGLDERDASPPMPILQPLEPSTVPSAMPRRGRDRTPARVLLAGDGPASAIDSGRLIDTAGDLVAVGYAGAAHETLQKAQNLRPDVVVLDRALSHDVVLLARELTSGDHAPALVVRSARPEPVMTIAAIVAGVRGIVDRSDPADAFRDAIRWVAAKNRWLADTPPSAVSRAGSRVERNDLPIFFMLLRGTPSSDIAAKLGISVASLDVRRSTMVRDILGEPMLTWSPRAWRAGDPAPAVSEADPQIQIAA